MPFCDSKVTRAIRGMNCPHGFSSILPFTALHHGLRIGSQHQGQLQECVAPLALVLHWGPTHGFAPLQRSSPWANLWVHLRCSVHRNAGLVYPKKFMTQMYPLSEKIVYIAFTRDLFWSKNANWVKIQFIHIF